MPPPQLVAFPEREQLARESVPRLKMPPPDGSPLTPPVSPVPFVMVNPNGDRVLPLLTGRTEKFVAAAALRWTVSFDAPGPSTVRVSFTRGRADPRLIVPVSPAAKLITSAPARALVAARAARNV